MAKRLSHLDRDGKIRMVDVGHKPPMRRVAVAEGFIRLRPATLALIRRNAIAKGNVLTTAQIAGIQAAKRTDELIPLCHSLPISSVSVVLTPRSGKKIGIAIRAEAAVTGATGVEMEALTAVSVAALTIYDMCKAVDKTMTILDVRLVSKTKTEI